MNSHKPKYNDEYIPYYKSGYHDTLDLPPMTLRFSKKINIFFNENHDYCTSCQKHFKHGELTHLGYSEEGKFIYACNSCALNVKETVVRYKYSRSLYQIPPNNSLLWRYMDFTKYISILSNKALFFGSASMFSDPFEGARGVKDNKESYENSYIKELAKAIADKPEAKYDIVPGEDDIAQAKALYDQMTDHSEKARQYTFLNCWHENEVESDAMWYLYSKDIANAIAIQTTYERLYLSLDKNPEIHIGRVNYMDFSKGFTSKNSEYWFKRSAFAHEREVRAILINNDKQYTLGLNIPVNLDILIEKIFISPKAPEWFVSLISDINSKYGIEKKIVHSDISKKPFY